MRSKTKTCDFSQTLNKLQVIVRNSDRFVTLFAPVVVGQSNIIITFGTGFSTVIEKLLSVSVIVRGVSVC